MKLDLKVICVLSKRYNDKYCTFVSVCIDDILIYITHIVIFTRHLLHVCRTVNIGICYRCFHTLSVGSFLSFYFESLRQKYGPSKQEDLTALKKSQTRKSCPVLLLLLPEHEVDLAPDISAVPPRLLTTSAQFAPRIRRRAKKIK